MLGDFPEAFAALAAAAHLAGPGFDPRQPSSSLREQVRRTVATGTVNLDVSGGLFGRSDVSTEVIEGCANAWRAGYDAFSATMDRRGLRVRVDGATSDELPDVITCLRHAYGVDAVTIVDRTHKGPKHWSWPVRIATVGDESDAAVATYGHPQLLDRTRVPKPVDLLIADELTELRGEKEVLGGTAWVTAGVVLAFVESRETYDAVIGGAYRPPIPCRALAIARKPSNLERFLHCFLDELSHDFPPDVALSHAVQQVGDVDAHIILGDVAFLDRARVSVFSAHLETLLERALQRDRIDEETFLEASAPLRDLPKPGTYEWSAEGGAATTTVDRTRRARDVFAPTRGGGPQSRGGGLPRRTRGVRAERAARRRRSARGSRHLQAQVYARIDDLWVQRKQAFARGAPARLDVRIGYADLDWIQLEAPFPDHELPPEEARLTVTLRSPAIPEAPLSQEIYLGPAGASTLARFEFVVPADTETVDATLIVYHRGKHLQTAQLRGAVSEEDAAPASIEFILGSPARVDPAHQREFDLSIWKDGDELVFTTFDADAPAGAPSHTEMEVALAGIDQVLDGIRAELFGATAKMEDLEGKIESEGLEFLRSLAEQGEFLRRTLFGFGPLDHLRRIQVASPYAPDSFPVEFIYEYPLPDEDAPLCPDFKTAPDADSVVMPVGAGQPVVCAQCSPSGGSEGVVCPSGFWGLSRVIERQVRPTDVSCAQPESSAKRPGPLSMDSVIFAAADEVNADDPACISKTIEALERVAPVHPAATWSEWTELIEKQHPALLVALPHDVEGTPFHKLRISASEDLKFNRIGSKHVAAQPGAMGAPVLLFGCNTANAAVTYQDYVKQLRCAGAPLVVGTVTYVLGPQAARVATEFATQLWAHKGSARVGEVVRKVRENMLRSDNLMALALVAYGDTDWLI